MGIGCLEDDHVVDVRQSPRSVSADSNALEQVVVGHPVGAETAADARAAAGGRLDLELVAPGRTELDDSHDDHHEQRHHDHELDEGRAVLVARADRTAHVSVRGSMRITVSVSNVK